jgi:hypothetical protein
MKSKISILLLTILFLGCTKDFENINTNPLSPVDVQPEFLLRKVIYDYAEQMSYEGFVAGNLLGQYFTAIDFNLFDRHSLTEPQYGGKPWPFLYENLRDNEILLNKARSNATFAVYEGPALIMKAYMSSVLTDLYGDVPYYEALKGKEGIVSPIYNSQEDIYLKSNGILDNLDKGILAIKNYKSALKLKGDILYSGDLNKWIKFGNSLKIKLLMRISSKQNVSESLKQILIEGLYIKNSSENAVFNFSQSPPNNFRMTTAKTGDYNLFIMSKTADSILTQLNDPRVTVFFRPTASNASVYRGLLNGPDASKLSITTSDYSLTGKIFREEGGKLKANFITSFETNFLLAEAAEKGLISEDAKSFYDNGVTQSFQYWQTAIPTDYLTRPDVKYTNGDPKAISQIISQKWIGNIGNGYESWIEYRRTGFPKLKTISASLNQNLIPIRMPYPASEATLNTSNFQTAAQKYQNNSINAPVWWNK